MQLVLSGNRIIAHGGNYLVMGGVVINTETGAKYENATVAECDGCPSDINEVGYEYHAGTFVPCAPYGKGNNNGYFMEVCETCATPRSSGIPIKGGIKLENINEEVTAHALGGAAFVKLWENASPTSAFVAQAVDLPTINDYDFLCIEFAISTNIYNAHYNAVPSTFNVFISAKSTLQNENFLASCWYTNGGDATASRTQLIRKAVAINTSTLNVPEGVNYPEEHSVRFENCTLTTNTTAYNNYLIPYKIYGVKI